MLDHFETLDYALLAAGIFATGALTCVVMHEFDPSVIWLPACVAFTLLMFAAIVTGAVLDHREHRGR